MLVVRKMAHQYWMGTFEELPKVHLEELYTVCMNQAQMHVIIMVILE